MHVQSPIFHGQLKEKNLTDNFNTLGAGEVLKNLKKGKAIKINIVLL